MLAKMLSIVLQTIYTGRSLICAYERIAKTDQRCIHALEGAVSTKMGNEIVYGKSEQFRPCEILDFSNLLGSEVAMAPRLAVNLVKRLNCNCIN